MSVPTPTLGGSGFIIPSEAAVLAGVQADINSAFGGNLNQSLATPQGQLASSLTAIVGDAYALFQWFTQQVDPAYSEGRMQDGIARIYFLERIPSAPTVVNATCRGLPGVVIPVGALAKADDGNLYVARERLAIGDDGEVVVAFACTVDGPIPCPAGALNTIQQALNGWDSILNEEAGALGRDVESRSVFEERRALSTAINSTGQLPAIYGGVAAVEDVLDAFVTENNTPFANLVGGVWLAPHSIYVCVLGGEDQAVAEAIWARKAPGAGYTGNVTVTVEDPNPAYSPPPPSYEVTFQRPEIVDYTVLVRARDGINVPSDALAQVQAAVIAAFAGTDGGSRAKIGSFIFASRYYAPVIDLGPWLEVLQISVGRTGAKASIAGKISGAVLTVSSVVRGQVDIGDLVSGSSVDTGTLVTGLAGGTGGIGDYYVSPVQTSGTGYDAMLVTELSDVGDQLRIDEAPAISAPTIHLRLE